MDRLNKRFTLIVLVSIFISIYSCYSILRMSNAIYNTKLLINLDMNMYLLSLDCQVSEFEIRNGEIIYSVKMGPNTNEIMKYLNSEGYYISIKEKNNKANQLIDFQKYYRSKNNIKGMYKGVYIRDKIREDMTKVGYQWEY